MAKADTKATTYKEKKSPKIVSHIEIHPNMEGGHNVEIHHTHSFEHPPIVKKFPGPHEAVSLPEGHILHHIASKLGVETSVGGGALAEEERDDTGAGEGEPYKNQQAKEEASERGT